jgi:hypothetical protein
MEWVTTTGSSIPGTQPTRLQPGMGDGCKLAMQRSKSCVYPNHLLSPLPGMVVRLQLQLGPVHPVHEPVFQTMDGMVRVHECAKLIAGPAPGELPTPVSLQLVREGMRFYIVESQVIILRILQVFLSVGPLAMYSCFAVSLPIFL